MSFFLGPISVQRCRVLIRLEHWEEEEEEEASRLDEQRRRRKKKREEEEEEEEGEDSEFLSGD